MDVMSTRMWSGSLATVDFWIETGVDHLGTINWGSCVEIVLGRSWMKPSIMNRKIRQASAFESAMMGTQNLAREMAWMSGSKSITAKEMDNPITAL